MLLRLPHQVFEVNLRKTALLSEGDDQPHDGSEWSGSFAVALLLHFSCLRHVLTKGSHGSFDSLLRPNEEVLWVLPCLDCPIEHHAGNQLPWLRLGQSVVLGHNRGGSKDYSMHIIECSNFIQFEHWLNHGAGLPACRLAGVPGCRVAGLPGCRFAGLPGCRGAGVPGCRGAGLPGCRAARKMKTERKEK